MPSRQDLTVSTFTEQWESVVFFVRLALRHVSFCYTPIQLLSRHGVDKPRVRQLPMK